MHIFEHPSQHTTGQHHSLNHAAASPTMSNPVMLRPAVRPLTSTLCTSSKPAPTLVPKRLESTVRKQTARLRVPPSPSFANATINHDHIIFNPPSAAPNVFHTPLKFLPPGDRRRELYAATQRLSGGSSSNSNSIGTNTTSGTTTSPIAALGTPLTSTRPIHPSTYPQTPSSRSGIPVPQAPRLPPPVRQPYEKKYHLTAADIAEIRRLRAADPDHWTRIRLAEKFECSQFFVGLVAPNAGRAIKRAEEREGAMAKWGRRKRESREDRVKRKALWGRDL